VAPRPGGGLVIPPAVPEGDRAPRALYGTPSRLTAQAEALIGRAFAPFAEAPRWLVWRLVPRTPKPSKVPVSPRTGGSTGTDVAHESDWATLAEALREARRPNVNGIGLVIPEGVVCVDLDACTVKGEVFGPLEPWAREIVERLDTFTEYSPSGTGVHVWLWGVKPGDKCRKGTVEIYGGPFGRYITCTGRGFSRWGEAPIAERTDALAEVYRAHLDTPPSVAAWPTIPEIAEADASTVVVSSTPRVVSAPSVVAGRSARTAPPSALSDGQVLTAALKSRGANRIHALWGGDTSGHGGDQSAAEIALANHLAWWCAGDEAQVGRLMDTAPLCHRDKWAERPDYRARTVRAAVQGLRDGGWDGPTRRQAEEWYGADEADRLFGPRTRVERVNGRTRVVVAPEAGKGLQSDPEASYGPVAPTPQPAGPLGHHAGADGYALTDLGNAERLIARAEGRIAWHHAAEEWLVWNGIVWEPDTSGEVERLASAMARALWLAAAVAEAGDEARRALRQHAARTEGKRAISDAMALARNRPGAYVPPDALDVNPNVIVVRRGIVDLATGVLRPADPSAWLTKAVRHPDGHGRLVIADYVPGQTPATHPLWEAFLARVVPDPEVRAYLRRTVGLSLSGWTRDAIHVHVGSGANGKSTFLDTVRRAIGPDYAHVASLDVLMARKAEAGAPNPAVADLRGKRLVIASEAESSDRLAEGTVKAITSQGEAITARRLHANPITFVPSHTLHLHSNHRPVVRGTDEGIWRRVHLIPWTVTIPEAERDEGLKARLQAPEVLLGVLAWAMEGAREVASTGVRPPEAVRSATATYRAESDVFGQWLEERCVITPNAVAGGGPLHADYRAWCEANGHRALPSNHFADRLRGVSGVERGTGRERYSWRGIGLADERT
jgi:putative DNA primase/helicase